MQFRERAEAVVVGVRVQPARQQHGADEHMRRIGFTFGTRQFRVPETPVEGRVVRDQRTALRELRHFAHHGAGRWRGAQHRVADAGQLLDERRHPRAAVHQALEAADDLPTLHQHGGDLGRTRALAGREAGGFEVDNGNGFHAGCGLASRLWLPQALAELHGLGRARTTFNAASTLMQGGLRFTIHAGWPLVDGLGAS